MNAGDGGNFKLLQIFQCRIGETDFFRQKFGGAVVWQPKDDGFGGFFPSAVENRCSQSSAFESQAAQGRAKNYFAAFFLDGSAAAVIEFRQRHRRDAHFVARAIREKCFPENVDAEAGLGAVELFIESADQDHAPETLDGGRRLFAASQPFQHQDRLRADRVFGAATGKKNGDERASNRQFVQIRKRGEKKKRAGHVDRSRKKIRLHDAGQALWVQKNQAVKEFNFIGGADAAIK